MIVYIIPGEAPDLYFALSADGVVLKTFGKSQISATQEFYAKEYDVQYVARPLEDADVQQAIANNRMRGQLARDDADEFARIELFRWQFDELPTTTDLRRVDIRKAVAKMAVAIVQGEATRENTAIVLVYLTSLLPTLED